MRISNIALLSLAAALTIGSAPSASAAPSKKARASADTPPAKPKGATPKFIPSASQESIRERERRLQRECKGRPNAGACSGFAS